MAKAAWSFAHYTCGHQTPIRGGDRHLPYHCPDCAVGPDHVTIHAHRYAPGPIGSTQYCKTCGLPWDSIKHYVKD